ncbi:hypothetical protein ABT300_02050 [Streptomyces sp. NPDC001027]|uniref:hypothetical protein n=1 Tax=Streptomyces sp. NPDC001027 TaxID=3154771 RepID=UPI003333424E
MALNVKRSALAVGGLAIALGMMAQGSAQAATGTGKTSPSYYGNATFNTSTGRLTVNDTKTDSRRVVATVWNTDLGYVEVVSGQDANGDNGVPGTATASGGYSSGDLLMIEVCRRNGAGGADTDCGYGYVTA